MKALGFHCVPLALLLVAGLQLQGCSEKQPPATTVAPPAEQPAAQSADASPAPPVPAEPVAAGATWSPESLEELLAPVALYPDPVLAQVLATSTNPQEVLDAGNWLLQNQNLKGKQLEAAASSAGFTPPMIALVQFPTVVDMMCMEMDWTTEVGSAFQADEPGVLDAVQRLRKQAADMGNLQSSEQMKVVTTQRNDQPVIIVEPAKPEVVYVPQYDPAAVYTTPAPAAAVATTTTTGHSTGTLVTTGLLAFGAGILVGELFDDDDHDHDYYYPRWGYGYGGPAYYPPPYRPVYGSGFRPAHGYHRPVNYQHGFNNNNVFINTGGDNYWRKNRFDSNRKNNYRREARSPISAARPSRPELQQLNKRPRPAATTADNRPQAGDWKGKTSYAGAKAGARDKAAVARPADSRVAKAAPSGSYAGAKDRAVPRQDVQQQKRTAAKPRPQTGGARDRGRESVARSGPSVAKANRPAGPAAGARKAPKRSNAFEGARSSGKAERQASQRGRASASKGSRKPAGASKNRGGKRGNKG